jgi:hypothetical protein
LLLLLLLSWCFMLIAALDITEPTVDLIASGQELLQQQWQQRQQQRQQRRLVGGVDNILRSNVRVPLSLADAVCISIIHSSFGMRQHYTGVMQRLELLSRKLP